MSDDGIIKVADIIKAVKCLDREDFDLFTVAIKTTIQSKMRELTGYYNTGDQNGIQK